MTYADLARKQRERIEQLRAERKTHADAILAVQERAAAENRDTLTEKETADTRPHLEARARIDEQVGTAQAALADLEREAAIESHLEQISRGQERTEVRTGAAERTYTPDTAKRGTSFFRDMYRAEFLGDWQARERQGRYRNELEVDRQERAATTSSYAGLIPPQYLLDLATLVARAGRPIANTVLGLQLPDEGMSLIVPRGTTGNAEAVQTAENTVVATQDQAFTNLTVPVVTIGGHAPLSRQILERGEPGIDQLVITDLYAAYAVALDAQILSGTGSSGQMLGLFNTAGIVAQSAFTAAATPGTLLSKLAGAINTVETSRYLAPDIIYMHPRRWNWLTAQLDASQRPLVVPNANGPMNALSSFDTPVDTPSVTPVGQILGLPVVTDANMPSAVGTASEDQVVVARRSDLLLWEDGDGLPKDLRFDQTLGTQLTVELVAYGYAAFTAGRFPTGASTVGGNAGAAGQGLIAPTF